MLSFINRDDMLHEFQMALCRAAQKFRPESGAQFSTVVYWWFRAAIRNLLRDYRRRGMAGMSDGEECKYAEAALLGDCRSRGDDSKRMQLDDMREEYGRLKRCLEEREAEILEDRMNGLTLREIGQRLGMTRQRMQQIESTAIDKLRRKLAVSS